MNDIQQYIHALKHGIVISLEALKEAVREKEKQAFFEGWWAHNRKQPDDDVARVIAWEEYIKPPPPISAQDVYGILREDGAEEKPC